MVLHFTRSLAALFGLVCVVAQAQPADSAAPSNSTQNSESAPAKKAAEPPQPAAAPSETAPAQTIPVQALNEEPAAKPSEKALATTDDATRLDAVIVTSSKRSKNIRDEAGSVTALRGKDLEKIKAQGMADYIKLIPGVVLIDRGGADSGQPIIRGISTSSGALGTQFTQQPVGLYVDELPFTDLYAPLTQPDLNPFDLNRVEILKGPQGALFGSGALAGAVRYILQRPKFDKWETKLSSTVGFDAQGEGLSPIFAGAQNVPLFGDTAALRVVALSRRDTGRIDEVGNEEDVDRLKQVNGRILGSWQATEKLKLDAFYFLQDSKQQNSSAADNPERFERMGQVRNLRQSGFSGANLAVGYAFDRFSLLSSSSYLHKEVDQFATESFGTADPNGDPDGDGGANGPGTEDAGNNDTLRGGIFASTNGLIQEFRISSPEGGDWQPLGWLEVQWLAGVSFQATRQGFVQSTNTAASEDGFGPAEDLGLIPIVTPIGPVGSSTISFLFADLNSLAQESALYADTTLKILKDLEFTVGGRLFKTSLRSKGYLEGAQILALNPGMSRAEVDEKTGENGFNPKVSLRYVINPNLQLYTLAAKGFQFGGIQLNPPLAAVMATEAASAYEPYKSSKLWNYELGLRTEFFKRRLKFDITAFYVDWKDLQITVPVSLVPMGEEFNLTLGFTENIGRAKSTGVETSLSVSPVKGLNFTSNAAWVHAVTTEDFNSAGGFVPKGTRLPASPRFQMANVLSYNAPFTLLGQWQAGLSLTHVHMGGSFNSLQYNNPNGNTRSQGDYDTLDLSTSLGSTGGRFLPELTLSMLNLTDTRGVAAVSSDTGSRDTGYFFIRPRTALVSLSMKF